jgi:hypothetical protein
MDKWSSINVQNREGKTTNNHTSKKINTQSKHKQNKNEYNKVWNAPP